MVFDSQGSRSANKVKQYSGRDSLTLYPSDSRIEYVRPNVEEAEIRASLRASSILSRIKVKGDPSVSARSASGGSKISKVIEKNS